MEEEKYNEYDEEFEEDLEKAEDTEEQDDDYTELAPKTPIAYIKFMLDKENKKETYSSMPKTLQSKVFRYLVTLVITIALGIACIIVYKSLTMLWLAIAFSVVIAVLTLRLYLIGTRRQYVQFKGTVVRSDYTKSVIEATKNKLQKTMSGDFKYRTFIVKTEEEYVRVNCRKSKELPQEGDAVRVTLLASSTVYEEDGLTTISSYIDIERIA